MEFSPLSFPILFKVRDIYGYDLWQGLGHLGPRSEGNTLMKCVLKKSTSSLPGAQGQVAPENYKTRTFYLRISCIRYHVHFYTDNSV